MVPINNNLWENAFHVYFVLAVQVVGYKYWSHGFVVDVTILWQFKKYSNFFYYFCVACYEAVYGVIIISFFFYLPDFFIMFLWGDFTKMKLLIIKY